MVDAETMLEVGGGIGALQVELLRRGLATALAVDLSSAYEAESGEILARAGFANRVVRRWGDFVALAPELDRADLVVMHSVVCCYPDLERLVGAAADKADRYLVISYPKDAWWSRSFAAVQNSWYRTVMRTDFRFWIHSPDRIHGVAGDHGLELFREESATIDVLAVYRRLP